MEPIPQESDQRPYFLQSSGTQAKAQVDRIQYSGQTQIAHQQNNPFPRPLHVQAHDTIECVNNEQTEAYPCQAQKDNSCSSSTIAATTAKRESSVMSSLFKPSHRRRPSSVEGWDSGDDEELDQTITPAGSNTMPTNEKSPWLRRENAKRKQVRRCLCLAVILCFLVLGTVLAFAFRDEIFSRNQQGPSVKREEVITPHLQGIEETYHVNKTITPDPRLKKIFYGIDYTPRDSQEPGCKVNLGHVIEDMKVLSQLTNRIRLYGMACQQSEAVLKAIEYLDLPEMEIILTLWVDHNNASWEKQSRVFWNLIDHELRSDSGFISNMDGQSSVKNDDMITISKVASRISGISVGNEVLFRNENKATTKEYVPLSVLTGYIDEIRTGLATRAARAAKSPDPAAMAMGQRLTQIPIFSSDLGRNAGQIVDQVDMVMSNIHPFFAYTSATEAADWAFKNFRNETVGAARGKLAAISEIGWPSGPASAKLGSAVPSIENLQIFIDSWVCQANKKSIPYYYFEAFDEPWKNSINARESQWGLMTVNRQLKVSLPSC
ncbi:hypothetical protein BX616_007074 [Lobosporangium transversale]|uniref:glucan endo-1,3-beta-D-glucosidase n=1 Tax=Lobosporangium transversale TaxID=64571 RepID=A0A1Y2GZQ8_9FUNG|nr:glycoside hydrolase superfamily [Lobosporangium transversale]KAF9918644.1 hypothetical protein BX616_007074 [Lobosporangium transversale]ORZ27241.1 glycoside hydrolase superfamily [Lobosporangium transversale]|eukprot:XP_021884968.1 glycoside hydrolase superfamily [Lobosporangium transversale]